MTPPTPSAQSECGACGGIGHVVVGEIIAGVPYTLPCLLCTGRQPEAEVPTVQRCTFRCSTCGGENIRFRSIPAEAPYEFAQECYCVTCEAHGTPMNVAATTVARTVAGEVRRYTCSCEHGGNPVMDLPPSEKWATDYPDSMYVLASDFDAALAAKDAEIIELRDRILTEQRVEDTLHIAELREQIAALTRDAERLTQELEECRRSR